MQALAAEAGRPSASTPTAQAMTALVAPSPPRTSLRERRLWSGVEVLDRFLDGFEFGQLTALDASSPVVWDLALGAVCQATREGPVIAVDGGNSMDPYLLARHARMAGMAPRQVLGRLRVARAFTAHQLSAILEETLPAAMLDAPPVLLLASCLPELYLDEDVPFAEGNALLARAVDLLRDAARTHGCVVLATNLGVSALAARPRLREAFLGADRVVRLLRAGAGGEGVLVEEPALGRALRFRPAPHGQRTLMGFAEHEAMRPPLGAAPPQLMVKGVG